MKDYLKEFEEALDKIVKPVLEDDWDDDFEGGDDDDAETGFSRETMFVQLGRILDSQGNPNPVKSVITDDGDKINVSAAEARAIRGILSSENIKPQQKMEITKLAQTTDGLKQLMAYTRKKGM